MVTSLILALTVGTGVLTAQQTVFTQINDERRSDGIASLTLDSCLTAAASERANDMRERNYFAHLSPDGHLPWDEMRADGCAFHYAAENIAEAPDPLFAVTELWNSPPHRRNTLDAHYRKVGIGTATRPDGTIVFVEEFSD